jgi:hypothetical protein
MTRDRWLLSILSLVAMPAACSVAAEDEGEPADEALGGAAEIRKELVFESPFSTPKTLGVRCSAGPLKLSLRIQDSSPSLSTKLQVLANGHEVEGHWELADPVPGEARVVFASFVLPVEGRSTKLTFAMSPDDRTFLLQAKVRSVRATVVGTCGATEI